MGSTGVADRTQGGTTLRDPEMERRLLDDGFVVMPLLDDDEVQQLSAIQQELASEVDDGLTVDYLRTDRSVMAQIRDRLAPLWERRLPQVFTGHRAVFTTFVAKHPGPGSDLYLHDDRSWVDERCLRSGTLWIPLVDVGPDIDNGGLELVRHSHLLGSDWSGSNTPDLIRPFEPTLRAQLERPSVPAGAAVFYDSRTLHASPANDSDRVRVAVVCAVVPERAALLHAVATGRRHRVLHAVDEQFFIDHGPDELQAGMPDGYAVLDEFDVQPVLGAHRVAEVLRIEPAAVRMRATAPASARELLEDRRVPDEAVAPVRRLPLDPGRDLHARAQDLGALPLTIGTTALRATGAAVGAADAASAVQHLGLAAAALEQLAARTDLLAPTVVLLEPGARLVLEAATADSGLELAVIEAPAVAAGVVGNDLLVHLEPGDCHDLDASTRHVVWNDGPGPFVAALSPHRSTVDAAPVSVLVIAYEAASTIRSVLERTPTTLGGASYDLVVADDASRDDTAEQARDWVTASGRGGVHVLRRERNLGYGGNQVAGFRAAIERGSQAVAVLHGDGQYPPERLEELVAPILAGRADAVFGSRMIDHGAARRGGMPLDRFVGNRALSALQNRLTGARLTEWHSGLRAYRVSTLADIGLDALPAGFDFDTAITLRLLAAGARLAEIPIPTHYGDEVSHIDPYRTGLRILHRTLRQRRAVRAGPGRGR